MTEYVLIHRSTGQPVTIQAPRGTDMSRVIETFREIGYGLL